MKQAQKFELFDDVSRWTLKELELRDPDFIKRHSAYMRENPKGMGHYIWKPKVLLEELRQINHGDILVMLDSGCQLNITSASTLKFKEYVAKAVETGGVFMQLTNGAFGIKNLSDSAWTKLSLLKDLDPKSIYRTSGQAQSGVIIVQKSPAVLDFAHKWLEYCEFDNNKYLTSPYDTEEQLKSFQAHRWEQSIMSLLVKQFGFTLIKDETFFAPNWEKGSNFPIWTMRNRSGGDAYRRNILDLTKILLARITRGL